MKIAFIIYDLNKGGAERVVSLLSTELSKNNEVYIITFNNTIEFKYDGKIINLNIPTASTNFGKVINVIKRIIVLKKLFKQMKFTKIFSFMESANFATLLTGYDCYISIRTNPIRFSKLTKKIISLLYNFKNVKKVITVSKDAENILNRYGINQTQTIYNPIDFNLINSLSKNKVDINYPYIISIGRLNKVKNFDLLIKAYSLTKIKEYLKLIIVGDGEEKDNLQKLINKLNLNNNVVLYGKVDNVYSLLSNATMFILSSKFEGFPNTLIEALASRLPCISTDCPTGPREIIKDSYNGLLIENENCEAMSKAIEKLYFNEELKKKFKLNAKSSIKHLNIKNISKQWISI